MSGWHGGSRGYTDWTVAARGKQETRHGSEVEAQRQAHSLLFTGTKKALITEWFHEDKGDQPGKKIKVTKVEPTAAQKKMWR